jgi:hypothetical protein
MTNVIPNHIVLRDPCAVEHDNATAGSGVGGDEPSFETSATGPLPRRELITAPLKRSVEPASEAKILRDRLEFLRSIQKLTPTEIAARAGITLAALLDVESGTRPPTASEVLGLSWAFGVPYEKVFPGFEVEA